MARITISYPENIEQNGEGLVGFDCWFGPMTARSTIYQVSQREDGWTFAPLRRSRL